MESTNLFFKNKGNYSALSKLLKKPVIPECCYRGSMKSKTGFPIKPSGMTMALKNVLNSYLQVKVNPHGIVDPCLQVCV